MNWIRNRSAARPGPQQQQPHSDVLRLGTRRAPIAMVLLLAILAVSCTSEKRTVYNVKGVIKEISTNGMQAQIAHEDIPGYMDAMTMMFDVKNSNELAGLAPNDQV